MYSQTKMFSDIFNISHIISLFAIVKKMVIKWQELKSQVQNTLYDFSCPIR